MSKGLRLDPSNKSDLKWLEKRLGKDNTQSLLSSSKNRSILPSGPITLRSTEITESSPNKTRTNKYGNTKVYCNTLQKWIDSIGEHNYLHVLFTLEGNGTISKVESGIRYPLIVNGTLICKLEMDYTFTYKGDIIYADYKSIATSPPGYRFKKKLFEAVYESEVHIIYKDKPSIITEIIDNEKPGPRN